MKEPTKSPCESVINIQLVSGILNNSCLMCRILLSRETFAIVAKFSCAFFVWPLLSLGYQWSAEMCLVVKAIGEPGLHLSYSFIQRTDSDQVKGFFWSVPICLVILRDMINVCLSLHKIVVWQTQYFVSPSNALIYQVIPFLDGAPLLAPSVVSQVLIRLHYSEIIPRTRGNRAASLYQRPDLFSFTLRVCFIPVRSRHHRRSDSSNALKRAMLQWPQIPTGHNPSEITFQSPNR